MSRSDVLESGCPRVPVRIPITIPVVPDSEPTYLKHREKGRVHGSHSERVAYRDGAIDAIAQLEVGLRAAERVELLPAVPPKFSVERVDERGSIHVAVSTQPRQEFVGRRARLPFPKLDEARGNVSAVLWRSPAGHTPTFQKSVRRMRVAEPPGFSA